MAQYFPPVRSDDDPGGSLDDHPCEAVACCSPHQQFAKIVFLLAAKNGISSLATLQAATKKFRNMPRPDMLQFMITCFTDVLIATATSENLKQYYRLSDQQLMELFIYCWQQEI